MKIETLLKAKLIHEELIKWQNLREYILQNNSDFITSIESHVDTKLWTTPYVTIDKKNEKVMLLFLSFVDSVVDQFSYELDLL